MVLRLGFFVGLVFIELVGSGNDAVVTVGHAFGSLIFIAFGIGFDVVGEELQSLVEFVDGSLIVLAHTELTGFFNKIVETGHFFGIKLLFLSGLGQFFLGQFVVGENFDGCLKLHDGCIEILLFQQTFTLAHGSVEGILFVLTFFQNGARGFGLAANIFVVRENFQGSLVFSQGFLIFLLAVVLVAGIQMSIEHFLTGAVFLDLLHSFVQLLFGRRVVGFLLQCHLKIGLRADIVLGREFVVAFLHQRLVGFCVLGLDCGDTEGECGTKKKGE